MPYQLGQREKEETRKQIPVVEKQNFRHFLSYRANLYSRGPEPGNKLAIIYHIPAAQWSISSFFLGVGRPALPWLVVGNIAFQFLLF